MEFPVYDWTYGRKWSNIQITAKARYQTTLHEFHAHSFYEINLVFTGKIRILMKDRVVETDRPHLVLAAPGTPHYVRSLSDTILYNRLYLRIAPDFIENRVAEWQKLSNVFDQVLPISEEQTHHFETLIKKIGAEENLFRRRLLIYYYLSQIGELSPIGALDATPLPPYIIEALSYIEQHFHQKILAQELAQKLYISRTTLMMNFKKYIGSSLNDYINQIRLKNAVFLLQEGKSVQETAELCGFADSSGLIRQFKKNFGTTPKQYLSSL